jgi:hypothetical protein
VIANNICLVSTIVPNIRAMKRTLITAFVAATLLIGAVRTASATEVGYGRRFGLGFVLGDPTGLTGKLWVGSTNSIDFGLGFWGYGFRDNCWYDGAGNAHCDRYGYHNGTINLDYLWQSNIVRGAAQLDWHIGAGGRAVWFGGCSGDCFDLAARMPVGLDLMFNNPSFIEVFFELAPAFYIVPGFGFTIEGGLGARFYF